MSQVREESIKKITGLLISVLGGDHSDSRDLAMAQLAQLGPRIVPYLQAFLLDETNILQDIAKLKQAAVKNMVHPQPFVRGYDREENLRRELDYIESEKKYKQFISNQIDEVGKLTKEIEKKYGISLGLSTDPSDNVRSLGSYSWPCNERRYGMIAGILDVLSILEDDTSKPILMKLAYDDVDNKEYYRSFSKSLNQKIKKLI